MERRKKTAVRCEIPREDKHRVYSEMSETGTRNIRFYPCPSPPDSSEWGACKQHSSFQIKYGCSLRRGLSLANIVLAWCCPTDTTPTQTTQSFCSSWTQAVSLVGEAALVIFRVSYCRKTLLRIAQTRTPAMKCYNWSEIGLHGSVLYSLQ